MWHAAFLESLRQREVSERQLRQDIELREAEIRQLKTAMAFSSPVDMNGNSDDSSQNESRADLFQKVLREEAQVRILALVKCSILFLTRTGLGFTGRARIKIKTVPATQYELG